MANEMRDRLKENISIIKQHNERHTPVFHITDGKKHEVEVIAEIVEDVSLIIEKMEKQTLIELPCKVGDTVYYINRFYHIELRKDTIYKAKVVRIVTNSLGTSLVIQIRGEHGCTELSNIDCVETPNIEDFSKTVFLTKSEAEQKLKEMMGE